MFDSNYPAQKVIDEVKNEVNIGADISTEQYMSWINMVEQLLYSDIIKEQRVTETAYSPVLYILDMPHESTDDVPRPQDIRHVYLKKADGKVMELEHSDYTTVLSHISETNAYVIDGGKIHVYSMLAEDEDSLLVVRYARPYPKFIISDNVVGNISLPVEYVEMVRCRLRGERYRLLNEDALCAKWINEYNAHLEDFKNYISARRATV